LYHSYEAAGSHRTDYVSEWRERLFDTEGTGEGVRRPRHPCRQYARRDRRHCTRRGRPVESQPSVRQSVCRGELRGSHARHTLRSGEVPRQWTCQGHRAKILQTHCCKVRHGHLRHH